MSDTIENTVTDNTAAINEQVAEQNSTVVAIVPFNPTEIATFGNNMIKAIVTHDNLKIAAESELKRADEREKIIDTELVRVALYLHETEKVDLYDVFKDDKNSSMVLYRKILIELGVLVQKIEPGADAVTYEFTDPELKEAYYFSKELEKSNEAEYKARRARRNHLNIRLARACKAGIALVEAGAKSDNVVIKTLTHKDGSIETVPVITAGPVELMGKSTEVRLGKGANMEGASVSPTITGLSKIADKKHKATTSISAAATESTTRVATSNAEDFMALANTFIMAVKAKENEFDETEKALLKNVLTTLRECGIK